MEQLLLLKVGCLYRIDIDDEGAFQAKAREMVKLARGLDGIAGIAKQG
jgi:hypothetical protein